MDGMSETQPEEAMHRRVRAEHRRLGLTQKEVAVRAGIGVRSYQMYENGKTKNPQPENIRNIMRAVVLDLEVDEADDGRETRAAWPLHVKVFLDTIGEFLMTMEEAERLDFIHAETRKIFKIYRERQQR